ncbi:hypothetical protein EVJ58_g1032 [Rhodofomes roseus]|uniref:Uncharacterized protein n=1 Tax=Rhodofomes roseus TaxID=34475 RepID=A0A4Y9Z1K6_9APHY|nr:hypothetical protein EVJ58_g1032 [Rhodofomes roseus]
MSLPSGTYTITNVSYRNRASLTSGDDQEFIHCKLPGAVGPKEQWSLTSFPGDRFWIVNEDCKLHIATHPNAAIASPVFGTRVNTSMAWIIKEVPGDDYGPDVYSIHSEEMTTLAWTLNDGRDGTPISLQNFTKDRRNLWQISTYPPVQRKEFPFKDRSTMTLSSVEPTAEPDYLAVHCDWKGLPPGYSFEFPEPLLLLHHSEVVGEMMIPADGKFTTDSGSIYMEFHPRDTPAFKTFAAAIMAESDVQVYLQIEKFRFYHSGSSDADKSYVYRSKWSKELIFKGLHAFRECVSLRNLKIQGSSSDNLGPYIVATVEAGILNPCVLKCTSNIVISIHHGSCKLGSADLKDFTVTPQQNESRQITWKFRPMSPANDELRSFLDKCFMTEQQLPIRLGVDAISTTICGRLFNLPRFDIETHIQAFAKKLITKVNVRISAITVFKRELTFDFEMQNPFSATLELQNIQLKVSIRGTHIATVKHTFDPASHVALQADGQAKSPKISNCWLNASYLKAFQLAYSAKTPLDVEVTTADLSIDQYPLKGLSYNLYDIPFKLNLF